LGTERDERGHGLALFLARGMAAWVAAIEALAPAASKPRQLAADDAPHSLGPALPISFRAELTTVLAGMVLACSRDEEEAVG
jgi:hypothetical protein